MKGPRVVVVGTMVLRSGLTVLVAWAVLANTAFAGRSSGESQLQEGPKTSNTAQGAQVPGQSPANASVAPDQALSDQHSLSAPSNVGPPVSPKVQYQNGLLTLEAPNSTLGDILAAIRSKTGIEFEGVGNPQDRVVAFLGPAPVDRVLAGLLHGSRFDYIILAQPTNEDVAQRVVLSLRGRTEPKGASAAAAGQPVDEEESGEGSNSEAESGVQAQPPPQSPVQVQQNPDLSPKTSEQLMQELRQMQFQQQQQQQNPMNPPPQQEVPQNNQVTKPRAPN